MEKLHGKISLSMLSTLFRRTWETKKIHGDFIWRLFLGCALCVAIVIGFFSWQLYDEVTTVPLAPPPAKNRTGTLSIDELRAVISTYQKKNDSFNTLLSLPPPAPLINKGSGVSVPVNPG